RLRARFLEDAVGGGDGRHRLYERFEELRLASQLLYGRLMAAALRDDQVRRESCRGSDRAGETDPGENGVVRCEPDDGENRRNAEEQRQNARSRSAVEASSKALSDHFRRTHGRSPHVPDAAPQPNLETCGART